MSVKVRPHSQGESVQIGYVNRNGQRVIAASGLPGTDHGQYIYVLRCGRCGRKYGSNGSDNFQRKCPKCQGGRPGVDYSNARKFTQPEATPAELETCPFCDRVTRGQDIIHARAAAVVFPDAFPVSVGHVLVVPRRHLARVEDLEADEWGEVFALVREVCRELSDQDGVDGVNVGVNSGVAAGQTVDHAHVHVIPRRLGDVPDPRGGIRHVIPGRGSYWSDG